MIGSEKSLYRTYEELKHWKGVKNVAVANAGLYRTYEELKL